MTPSGNPAQQRVTAILMSGFFTFLFATFPSGLVLYWLTYNLLSIGQQHLINKYLRTLEVSHETQ
jgi:YidC/Oxa1 family membrane protein insertase